MRILLCGFVLGGMLWAAGAYAVTFYVSRDGNGTDGLSWDTAFPTISEAIASATGGDHVWVREGSYREGVTLKNRLKVFGGFSGTEATSEFWFRDPKVHLTVLDGTDLAETILVGAGEASCDGFRINALRRQSACVAVINQGTATFYLSNCEISDMTRTSNSPTIGVGNSLLDCSNCFVREIDRNRDSGGNLEVNGGTTFKPSIFTNCIFHSEVKGRLGDDILENIPSIAVSVGNSAIVFVNCVLKISARSDLVAYSVHAVPNPIPNGGIAGINSIFVTAFRTTLHFNIRSIDNLLPWLTGIDPLFVDEANGDFHLLPDSPAVDTGVAEFQHPFPVSFPGPILYPPSDDLDGNQRPMDVPSLGRDGEGAFDMGAYELQAPFRNSRTDINGDGEVDAEDLCIFLEDWGKVSGP